MRKSNNSRPGPGNKERSFKSKDGGRNERKQGGSYSDRPSRTKDTERGDKKPFGRKPFGNKRERSDSSDEKPRRRFDGERPSRGKDTERGDKKPFGRKPFGDKRERSGSSDEKPRRRFDNERPSRARDTESADKRPFGRKPFGDGARQRDAGGSDEKPRRSVGREKDGDKKFRLDKRKLRGDSEKSRRHNSDREHGEDKVKRVKFGSFEEGKEFTGAQAQEKRRYGKPVKKPVSKPQNDDGLIRLNKYLSNAGVASRREADTLIQSGVVKVNGVVVDQLGYKIKPGDKVTYGDAPVKSERKVYLLLNKPKDYITTTDDPQERKTVMELVAKAGRERIYPVGRLDRNTTGLLLFTNDGELATRLMHPKFRIKKVYHVSLNKGLKPDDFRAIMDGIELEDGLIQADDLAFVGEGKKEIGIEIHSGRNRIVRRIFEHLGYDVIKLDRVAFAGLTKKDLPRGKYRFLTAKEIAFLQMIG